MTSLPEANPPRPPDAPCPLCSTPVAPHDDRCPECGYSLAGVGSRPGPWSRAAVWGTVLGLVAIYLIAVVIVMLAR